VVVPLPAAALTARAILFGKTPAHGDFVQRGLDEAGEAAWDAWASGVIGGARAALGEAFDAAHGAAPVWRFLAGPGRLGEGWRAGAAAPSIDSAGRRYLLVLAADGLTWPEAAAFGAGLAAAMEAAIYDALSTGLDADAVLANAQASLELDPAVATAFAAFSPAPPAPGLWWTLGGARHAAGAVVAADPPDDIISQGYAPGAAERVA
jgi:type VI secretion system ImpM family protein